MNNLNITPVITRRHFTRTLARTGAVLALGSALPTFAAKAKKGQGKTPPVAPAQPDSALPKYETKVLWDFDGCLDDRFMNRVSCHVYNGNVYLWVLLPEYKTMIVKVPLAGGQAQMFPLMPGHVTGKDPHRFYTIAADSLGYIHVVGDMHASDYVKHWISKKPEDISEFVFTSDKGETKRPQGYVITYPHLVRNPDGVLYHFSRCGTPVWGMGISVLDVKTQTWTMLGADVPADALDPRRAKKAKGKPMTVWEDNGEGGFFKYTQPHAAIRWDKKKRMHVVFGVLNANTPSSTGRHTGSDVLYAYSDDGGKTFHKGDGSPIKLPMRADAGPYQADVVYSRHDGPPRWIQPMPSLTLDDKDRPVVGVHDFKTGSHRFVLEKGKWIELEKSTSAPTNNPTAKSDDEDEDNDSGMVDVSKLALPYEPVHPDWEHLRETGNLLYFAFPNQNKHNRILLVLSKPVVAKEGR